MSTKPETQDATEQRLYRAHAERIRAMGDDPMPFETWRAIYRETLAEVYALFERGAKMTKTEECPTHRRGGPADDDGEMHEPHTCPTCGAECDGDSPCMVMIETEAL